MIEVKRKHGDVAVLQDGGVVNLPGDMACRMIGLDLGAFEVVPASAEEAGTWVARREDWVELHASRPRLEAGPEGPHPSWVSTAPIRSYCWGTFSKVTGILIDEWSCGKYKLRPA